MIGNRTFLVIKVTHLEVIHRNKKSVLVFQSFQTNQFSPHQKHGVNLQLAENLEETLKLKTLDSNRLKNCLQ
jgi:hypothetical protein